MPWISVIDEGKANGELKEKRGKVGNILKVHSLNPQAMKDHAEALNNYWKDNKRVKKLIQDFRSLDLPERTHKMLEYAFKLIKKPHAINQADINNLRDSEFSDEEILNINLVTSYFNFVNRIALGLGVESAPEEVRGYKY